MSDVLDLDDVLPNLGFALTRAGLDRSRFVAILEDAAQTEDTLTADEVVFAVSAGVPAAALTSDAVARAQITSGVSEVVTSITAVHRALSTGEVAARLGVAPAHVRRLLARGDISAAGRGRNNESVFPAWQFVGDRPVPGLRDVLAAFPADYHPLDVQQVMTTPLTELDGRSPVQWLASGGAPARVVAFVSSLALT